MNNTTQRLKIFSLVAPWLVGMFFLLSWEAIVQINHIPAYLLPGPGLVLQTLFADAGKLFPALALTAQIAFWALTTAVITGVALSLLMVQSKWLERSLFPYVVILQTMPIAAISPLIIVWLKDDTFAAMVLCAWMAAIFPIVANTTFGLQSCNPVLEEVFQVYGATRWQRLIHLQIPSALPYFLTGLRVSGGLALIGAIVAEFVAGTGGIKAGIAYQILMAGYNLQIPRLFAALVLTTGLGILIFVILGVVSDRLIGHWHESGNKSLRR
jgi:NitT/TauT family transport system permease protein